MLWGEEGKTMSDESDCHGTTFAKGQVWINNDQVEAIIKGDNYTKTKEPQPGDVGVYRTGGSVEHSVIVNK